MDFLKLMEEGNKLESSIGDQRKRITGFNEKLAKFMGLVANTSGMASHKRTYLLKEAEQTSDFPFLFGTVLERQLYAKYKLAMQDWRTYIKTGTQNDFRPSWLIGVNGLQGSLAPVQMRGEYKQDANLTDGKVQISLNKFGREFPLAWEAIINDDLSALSDVAERFANAATRTENRQATALFVSSTGPHAALFGSALIHPITKQVVNNKFSSTNKVNVVNADGSTTATTPAFNINTLAAAASAMRRFIDVDGEPVDFDGFELVVPPALEVPMLQALNPANIIQSGGDATAGVKAQIRSSSNTAAQMNITGHVNALLPLIDTSGNGNSTWYLFAKLSNGGYAVRLNFLKGHETPEICMKNPNKVSLGGGVVSPMEGDYESDSLRWRIRHIMGGVQVDPLYAAAFLAV